MTEHVFVFCVLLSVRSLLEPFGSRFYLVLDFELCLFLIVSITRNLKLDKTASK